MCKIYGKLDEDFFTFAAERVWYIGNDVTEETDKELEQLTQQVREVLDAQLWRKYELKKSFYHDQTLYYAYKRGFFDALRLFDEKQTVE